VPFPSCTNERLHSAFDLTWFRGILSLLSIISNKFLIAPDCVAYNSVTAKDIGKVSFLFLRRAVARIFCYYITDFVFYFDFCMVPMLFFQFQNCVKYDKFLVHF